MGSDAGSTGFMSAFDNLSVKTKVFGGFAVVLVFLCVLAATAFFSARQTTVQFGVYDQRVDASTLAEELVAQLLRMRFWTKTYSLNGDAQAGKEAQNAASKLAEQFDAAEKSIDDPEGAALVKAARASVEQYRAALERLVQVQTIHQAQMREEFDKLGIKLRGDFQNYRDALARSGMGAAAATADQAGTASTRLRLSAYRYLARGDAKDLEEIAKRQEEMVAALKQLNEQTKGTPQAGGYENLLTSVEAFNKAKETTFANLVLVNDIVFKSMVPAAKKAEADLEALRDSAHKGMANVKDETDALLASMSMMAMILGLAAVAAGILLAWFIGRGIASGIVDITSAMRELAGGNKAINVPFRGRKDEVGAMAAALQVFKDTAIEADRMAAEQKAEQEKRVKRGEFLTKLVADFNDAIRAVVEGVGSGASQMRSSAQALSAIAEETNNQSTTVAAAAEEASRSVQTVASAAEQLNASIAEINRQIDGSARLANGAVDQVRTTNQTVETLSSAAKEIGNVVQLIQDIAAQTNLLALNATIEAARAGEAGKGFAVVASEVKSLANQTAKATEDISAQIGQIQNVANQSVAAMAEVGKSVGQISEASSTVAAAAQEQAAATAEISRSVQQVSVGTSEVASNIVHVTKAAGETGQMSGQVLNASNELSKQAENLRKVVSQFITQVQAA